MTPDTDAPSTLLSASALCVQRDGRDVVRDVDLELRAGEMLVLLGPNGAGKSTLLDALAGMLAASRGRVQRSGRVAVALQSPDLARRSVAQNVELALAWWGVPRSQRATRARTALAELGVDHLSDRAAATLSGGERRRVHLARALAVRPDVLLLDEPFAGLDAVTRAELLGDAESALRSAARATIIVVHDRAEAWALADRLLVLLDGRIAATGPPRELLEHPPTEAVARFLGFNGSLTEGDQTLLTRPAHVSLDAEGPLLALVVRSIPLEDGVRLELQLDHGRLFTVAPIPGPRTGERVRLRVDGGVRFRTPVSTRTSVSG